MMVMIVVVIKTMMMYRINGSIQSPKGKDSSSREIDEEEVEETYLS